MTAKLDPLIGRKGEARLRYLDSSFEVLQAGGFVRCAVTGDMIPVPELKYWSVERQEPYKDAAASLQRHLAVKAKR
jgi:hypothetical protein